jgi:hypothetical protein
MTRHLNAVGFGIFVLGLAVGYSLSDTDSAVAQSDTSTIAPPASIRLSEQAATPTMIIKTEPNALRPLAGPR